MICFKNWGRETLFFAFCIITILHYWLTYVYNCKKENFDSSASEESIENVASLYDEGIVELDNLVVTGKLTVGGEVVCDGNGTAIIGTWKNNDKYALISDKDRISDDYGFLLLDNGNTYINSSGDGKVHIRNNNNSVPKIAIGDDIRFDNNLGFEIKNISNTSTYKPVDTGYAVKDYICTLADYRSKESDIHKYFIEGANGNWYFSSCRYKDKSDDCPTNNSDHWRYITILAIPRILFSKINNQYYSDSK